MTSIHNITLDKRAKKARHVQAPFSVMRIPECQVRFIGADAWAHYKSHKNYNLLGAGKVMHDDTGSFILLLVDDNPVRPVRAYVES